MKKTLPKTIAWCNGEWRPIDQFSIPIQDRGARLGDGIFETVLILKGETQLLKEHIDRWHRSASILHMQQPPTEAWLKPLIKSGLNQIYLNNKNGSLRLNWTRGDNKANGINIVDDQLEASNHRFWLEINCREPNFNTVTTLISSHERRNVNSLINQCKTFSYAQSIQARFEAKDNGYDDALLLSTNGDLACSTTANIIIKRNNEFLTPPLDSGCLPGIMRQQGLNKGLIKEANLKAMPEENDEWLLVNSLSCKPISLINDMPIKTTSDPCQLWMSLLGSKYSH